MRGAHMFLRKMTNKKTGRTYLSIVHSYRDKKTKKTRSKTIESLGYLDELEKMRILLHISKQKYKK